MDGFSHVYVGKHVNVLYTSTSEYISIYVHCMHMCMHEYMTAHMFRYQRGTLFAHICVYAWMCINEHTGGCVHEYMCI